MDMGPKPWTSRWADHLIDAFHEDSDAILARHAEALDLGRMDGLPDEVLELFRIDLERVRDNPEGAVRLLQASYEATFRTIQDLLRTGTSAAS